MTDAGIAPTTGGSTGFHRRSSHTDDQRWTWRTVGALLGVLAAPAALCAVLAVLAGAVGWGLTVRSVGAVAVLALVHGGLVALAVPRAGPAVRGVLSVVLALATAGIAVWLSGVFSWFGLRWVAAALPALAWLHPAARAVWRSDLGRRDWRDQALRYGPVLWSLAFAWAFSARWLASYYAPVDGAGPWRAFYVDIPWHIALTAEALDRAPTVYPWIPDVGIGYSWLFFGTLGLLGNMTGATAAQVLLFIGPAVLGVLVPAVIVAATSVLSRSTLAAVIAPILFTLTRSPIFGPTEGLQQMPQWVLINRDSTNAMVLSVVVVLVLRLHRWPEGWRGAPLSRWLSLLVLFLITFAVAASRGGAVLPVLGAAGLSWLVAIMWRREDRRSTTWGLAVVAAAVAAATFGVTKSSGSFRFEPLSFLPVQVVGGPDFPLATLASVAVMLAMSASYLLVAWWLPSARQSLPAVAGAALAGIMGAALFGHPAVSQLYFFHAAWPAIVIGMAVALALAVRRLGPLVLVVTAVAVAAVQLVIQPPAAVPPTPWEIRMAFAGGAALVLGAGVMAILARTHGWRRTTLFAIPAVLVALQPWSLPRLNVGPAVVSETQTSAAVSDGQLALLTELREISDPDDLVATNKHCQTGNVTDGNCDSRWWAVAAFAERRVLMEGWSYDYRWASSGTDVFAPYWDPALLGANDGFIADPSPSTCRTLVEEGVRWIYVDKREPWSARLSTYAEPVAGAEDAALYRLHADCG